MSVQISMPLFSQKPTIVIERISEFLAQNYHDLASIEDVSEEKGIFSFSIQGANVFLALMDAPIPWSDLEGPCSTSILWKNAEEEVRKHTCHMIVTITQGDSESLVAESTLLTQITAAVLSTCPEALGVYWGNATLVIPADLFCDFATKVLGKEPPVFIWVDFRTGPDGEGTVSGFTTGLKALGLMEIEAIKIEDTVAGVREQLTGFAGYLIENGLVVKDGDTIGEDENQKIRVVYAQSEFGHPDQVMRLEYRADKDSNLFYVEGEDSDMNAAIAKAKSTLAKVTRRFLNGELENFTVKVKVEDGESVEHFWISNTVYSEGFYSGTIEEEARVVSTIQKGQSYRATKEDVTDWMYLENEKMVGNFTLRAMLPNMPKEQADQYRAVLAPLEGEAAGRSATGPSFQEEEKLRKDVLAYIESEDFNDYLRVQYSIYGGDKQTEYRELYRETVQHGKLVMGFVWMANTRLTQGNAKCAPALLVAGESSATDKNTERVYRAMGALESAGLSQACIDSVNTMLADESFNLFRMRELPRELTGEGKAMLFDVKLMANCVRVDGEFLPFFPCFVAPDSKARIFPVPMELHAGNKPEFNIPDPAPKAAFFSFLLAFVALFFLGNITAWFSFVLGHFALIRIFQAKGKSGLYITLTGLAVSYYLVIKHVMYLLDLLKG